MPFLSRITQQSRASPLSQDFAGRIGPDVEGSLGNAEVVSGKCGWSGRATWWSGRIAALSIRSLRS